MTIPGVPPTQLVLEIPSGLLQQAWQQGQRVSCPQEQWRIYLNHLCFNTVLPWLQAEQDVPMVVDGSPEFWLPTWSLVNGSAIPFHSKRLVLLPGLDLDHSELLVPQEWIDISSWAADYYLAVQVNPDEEWVHLWGYATHTHLKTQAPYCSEDRTYRLASPELIDDLSVLWVVHRLYPDEPTRAIVDPLPSLPAVQATNLVQRLASPAIASPRLELPFHLWGSLLDHPRWHQHLYQMRCTSISMEAMNMTELATELAPVNLRQWFENIFDSTWQSLDTLLEVQPDLTFNFRRYETADPVLKRGRGMRLPHSFGEEPIALIVSLELEADERVRVRAQLYALGASRILPAGLQLEVVSDTGQVLESVVAREQDNCIQLPRFKCPSGRLFRLRTRLNYLVFSTAFMS